jgi:uncharacterized protein (DUF1800 family)
MLRSRVVLTVGFVLAAGAPWPAGGVAEAQVVAPAPDPVPPDARGRFFRAVTFRRGDFNQDAIVDLSDGVGIFNHLFLGGPATGCENAADTNKDLAVDISDGSFLLNWLFLGGPEPPAPGPLACGADPAERELPCEVYNPCGDDTLLVMHVLNRITFGPTEELLTRIQSRDDLIAYIEEQLAPPADYDQAVHEPELYAAIEALEIGFNPAAATANSQPSRLKAMLLIDAVASRWQLLHKVTGFWNNHFHTQIDAVRENFFGRGPYGGPAARANAQQFAAADADSSGAITEAEWNAFRLAHPGAILWAGFRRVNQTDPSQLTLDEYLAVEFAGYWKYSGPREQLGVSADMEKREYDAFRRYGFGSFRALTDMHAKSVAQVIYLNNYENTVAAPNENYGREFFELFTLGVDHVYTQRDIEEVAKVFTGWTAGWQLASLYDAGDILRVGHPEGRNFPLNQREPQPFLFAITQYWDDSVYTWGFHFGNPPPRGGGGDGHDWGRKDLFLSRYGGVDSLGNPAPPAAAVRIAQNDTNRTVAAAMAEFDQVLDRTVAQRDCAKFIATKLIQYFVTDDLSALPKTQEMPADLLALFNAADLDRDGAIEESEWSEPTADLPSGKPPEIFATLDTDGDGRITPIEYQEPDLLLDAIAAWRRSEGDIREVLRAILLSEEFLSLRFYRAKVKDPFELIASTLRAVRGQPSSQQLLLTAEDLVFAGMEHFNFSDPTGESELGFDWMHTVGLLERLKYVNRVANPASAQEARAVWAPGDFRARWGLADAARTVDFFALLLFGGDILDNQRALAEAAYNSAAGFGDARIRPAVAYLLSLPQFEKQ